MLEKKSEGASWRFSEESSVDIFDFFINHGSFRWRTPEKRSREMAKCFQKKINSVILEEICVRVLKLCSFVLNFGIISK